MIRKFKPMKARMRATFAADAMEGLPRFENIDKENEVLHGVQITLEGEAKGHGVWLDAEFCQAIADAGNAAGDSGVKVRFGHPAMCSDALGTYLGRATNFACKTVKRKSGEYSMGVFADIAIAPESHSSPKGDLGKWVMEAAENSPDTFGQSIVFTYSDMKSTDKEGKPILASQFENFAQFKESAGENKIYAVLGKFHGTDFTDTPAATDGVFSADDLASEAETMLSEHPEIEEAILGKPEKVIEFLDRVGLLESITNAKIDSLENRLKGMQSLKDKAAAEFESAMNDSQEMLKAYRKKYDEMLEAHTKEFESKTAELKAELDKAQADTITARNEVEKLQAELAKNADHCLQLENAHRTLTGSVLTIEESRKSKATSFADFYKEHGGMAAAIKADPETYKRLCDAAGVAPYALN